MTSCPSCTQQAIEMSNADFFPYSSVHWYAERLHTLNHKKENTMLDLMDLSTKHFQPQITKMPGSDYELVLRNEKEDHDNYTVLSSEQAIILRNNAHLLYRLLCDATE